MLNRLGKFLALVAVIVLMDGHWTALQAIAWARMIHAEGDAGAEFSETIVETLSGTRPCAMCKAIIGARSQEDDPETAEFRFVTIPLAPIAFTPVEMHPPAFLRMPFTGGSLQAESAEAALIDPPPRLA